MITLSCRSPSLAKAERGDGSRMYSTGNAVSGRGWGSHGPRLTNPPESEWRVPRNMIALPRVPSVLGEAGVHDAYQTQSSLFPSLFSSTSVAGTGRPSLFGIPCFTWRLRAYVFSCRSVTPSIITSWRGRSLQIGDSSTELKHAT